MTMPDPEDGDDCVGQQRTHVVKHLASVENQTEQVAGETQGHSQGVGTHEDVQPFPTNRRLKKYFFIDNLASLQHI